MRAGPKVDRERASWTALSSARAARRRVSGPLDRSAFRPRKITLPPPECSYELTRLSLYRLGLAGAYAKYRLVPRSAIVNYEELRESVRRYGGGDDLRGHIATLWRHYGAPSRATVDAFLRAAGELDRRGVDARPDELQAILARPGALAEARPGPVRDLQDARRRLLALWVSACAPRSTMGQLRDHAELALCFVLRRARQAAYAGNWMIARRVRSRE